MRKDMKWKRCILGVAATSALVFGVERSSASVFATMQVLGNTDGGANYFSNLNVSAGQTVNYEVVIQLATSGTNSRGPFTLASQTPGTDGVNSLEFDLNDSANGAFGTAALAASWKLGFGGPVEGSPAGHSLVDTYAAQASGVFVGAGAPNVIMTGTFTAGTASTETLKAAWNSQGVGGIEVNTTSGQQQLVLGANTEFSADPYVGYVPLTLSAVPEPASIALLAIAVPAMLSRRRHI